MHSFEVHSNESPCRKSGRLGLKQVWRSTASICSRHLCPAPIGRETGHSYCQSILILACILNPSDDLRDQPVLVVLSRTDTACGALFFICQERCAYRVLSDTFPCLFWECGPLWIFKVTGGIWNVNSIFMCADDPSTASLCVYVLLCLVHLFLRVLCHDLCHWNVHLFRRHVLHNQKHKYYALWSNLMKGCHMDRVLQPM